MKVNLMGFNVAGGNGAVERYGFNKEQGTKGKGKGADIFLSFYLFHIWLNRVKAHQIFIYCPPKREPLYFCSLHNVGFLLQQSQTMLLSFFVWCFFIYYFF